MSTYKWTFDQKPVVSSEGASIEWEDHTFFKLLYRGETFLGELIDNQSENNYLKIKINHRVIEVRKKGELDDLIAALGLDKPKIKKLKELQAPMPGRILSLFVQVGQELQPGDDILSLEAMKMENILKAEGTGIVKQLFVQSGQVVDKGSVLIEFE
jgi:biotin carboxyl carrier protein